MSATVLDETRERLDREMRDVLIRLSLLSQMPARAYGAGGAGHPSSCEPTGSSHPPYERLRSDYERATSNAERQRVIAQAKAELAPGKTVIDPSIKADVGLDQIIVEDGEGYDAQMVAERYGLAAAHVRRIRQRAERRPDNGAKLDAERLPTDRRRAEARRMRLKGMTTRQIAAVLGVKQPTIVEDLRAVA
jgi:hypothetical protein